MDTHSKKNQEMDPVDAHLQIEILRYGFANFINEVLDACILMQSGMSNANTVLKILLDASNVATDVFVDATTRECSGCDEQSF